VLIGQAPSTAKPASATAKPTAPAPPAARGQAAPTPTTAAEPDKGWPRLYTTPEGVATVYQPQVSSWSNDQKHMVAWAAVSYQPNGQGQPAFGTMKIEADTRVSVENRLVSFSNFVVAESKFASLTRDRTLQIIDAVQKAMPETDRILALDRVLAAIDASAISAKNVEDVKADPPRVFASTKPAILVNIDGAPIWSPIRDVDLAFAVNTNWDLFQAPSAKTFYLRHDASWYKAGDLNGPWSPAGTLPASFSKLPADESFKDVKANLPGKGVAAAAMPTVFVSHEPAELVLMTGVPVYQAVTGTSLLWVSNTESDVFRMGKTGPFYYLVAGRWFSAPGPNGPWTFATPTLPEDFKKIPLQHQRSRVLAAVPGTAQAYEAVLLAQIPQTARVNRKEVKAPDVVYQGTPEFQPIAKTSMQRAVNTDKDVIKIGDLYYMCFQAVWFMSKSASGPWEVATTVPKEIYEIPASSPAHSVTYVTIQESSSNSDWVTFAYVAGYTGMMVAWGCAVWGTGWHYPPYVYGGPVPIYYGYPRTYGHSAWYNPWTGAYGRASAAYGPYGGAGAGAVYNPRTGNYARGAAAYGPYGSRAVAQAWNPRTGTSAATRQGSSIYGSWGTTAVQRGDDWAQSARVSNNQTGTTTRGVQTSGGTSAVSRSGSDGRSTVARAASGDVYAGHDGNVYRKQNGSWQQWGDTGWTPTSGSANQFGSGSSGPIGGPMGRATAMGGGGVDVLSQLDRDSGARYNGASRTSGWSSYQSSPSQSRAGSYRSTGAGQRAR
jgi:hypothetical protein